MGMSRGGYRLLTPSGGHRMYGRQAGSTHPTGMLSFTNSNERCEFGFLVDGRKQPHGRSTQSSDNVSSASW